MTPPVTAECRHYGIRMSIARLHQVSVRVRAFTLTSVELIALGLRALSAFHTCSQSHCFTVKWSGERSLGDLRIVTLENRQGYITCNQERDWDGLTWLWSCVKTTLALQCHVLDEQVVTLIQWLLSHETAPMLQTLLEEFLHTLRQIPNVVRAAS